MKYIFHVARFVAAIIILQTLYFKFGAHPQSVELFTKIGMEPGGRIATWVIELIAGIILLFGGKFIRLGAGLTVLLMLGAVYYHVTILGIDQLFRMAIVALVSSIFVLYYEWKESENISAE